MKKNIELELRAEIPYKSVIKLTRKLESLGIFKSHARRLSVLFHGKINDVETDIRIRTKNKKESEIVVKRGDFHSHDRTEESISIQSDEFMNYVSFMGLLGFSSKIIERENFNYDLGKDVLCSVVKAKKIAYVEIEKMSDNNHKTKDIAMLASVASNLNLKVIENKQDFYELCKRLAENSDWSFDSKPKQVTKLKKSLQKYWL